MPPVSSVSVDTSTMVLAVSVRKGDRVLVTAILSPGSLLGRGGQDAVQLSLGETEVVGIVRP